MYYATHYEYDAANPLPNFPAPFDLSFVKPQDTSSSAKDPVARQKQDRVKQFGWMKDQGRLSVRAICSRTKQPPSSIRELIDKLVDLQLVEKSVVRLPRGGVRVLAEWIA